MGSLRRRTLTLGATAGLLALGAPAALGQADEKASAEKPATLMPPEQSELKRNLGEERGPHEIEILLDADRTLQAAPAVTVDDPRTSGGTPLRGTVTEVAELVGGRAVRVVMTVDPPEETEPATYTAIVRLRSAEIRNQNVSVEIELSRTPKEGWAWCLAGLALVIGVGLGGGLRWLAERGSKLHDLLGRYELASAAAQRPGRMPRGLVRDLLTMRLLLAQGDVTTGTTQMTKLQEAIQKTSQALDELEHAETALQAQKQRIGAMRSDGPLVGRLQGVVATELALLHQAIDATWPDPDLEQAKAKRAEIMSATQSFTQFLDHFRDPQSRTSPEFETALRQYEQGKFAEAHKAWAAREVAAGGVEFSSDLSLPTPRLAPLQRLAARNAPLLIGIGVSLALVIVGLLTVFKIDTMFLTDNVEDFLLLVAWGFGSAVTGVTLTQLAGMVPGLGPKT